MHKHNSNKHAEYQNFKMHLDSQARKACSKSRMITRDPIKLLGASALIGILLGLLIR
jgi:ElaB/YqjD/DUF883 family membrane-anchored ribosome-binding protein